MECALLRRSGGRSQGRLGGSATEWNCASGGADTTTSYAYGTSSGAQPDTLASATTAVGSTTTGTVGYTPNPAGSFFFSFCTGRGPAPGWGSASARIDGQRNALPQGVAGAGPW